MKLIFFILLSLSAFGSDTTALPKVDTAQWFYSERKDSISIEALRQWLYTRLPANKYDEFMEIYNTFLREKFTMWLDEKKKKK